jgi:dethiobiotin synthetase
VSLFVTGTDTGVGKTHITVRLLHLLRASGVRCAGMKPICCGDRQDAERLLAAGSDGLTIEEINPVWLKTPAAPIVGTFVEKLTVDIDQILLSFRNLQEKVEHVIVEGVGGWLVPIRSDYFVSDLAAAMKLPVLLVVQNRLGCLNHTALTVRSIAMHRLRCAGVVLNNLEAPTELATSTNGDILKQILDVPLLQSLGQNLTELPQDWRVMMETSGQLGVSR